MLHREIQDAVDLTMSTQIKGLESAAAEQPSKKSSPVDYISLMAGARPKLASLTGTGSDRSARADGTSAPRAEISTGFLIADGRNESGSKESGSEQKKAEFRFDASKFDDAKKAAFTEKRKMVIDAGASWCLNCRKMDNESWGEKGDPKVREELDKNYVFVKLDMDKHEELAKELGIKSVPAVFIGSVTKNAKGEYEFHPEKRLNDYRDSKSILAELQKKE